MIPSRHVYRLRSWWRRLAALGRSGLSTRARRVAEEDFRAEAGRRGPRFSTGTRPVIRWIKGDGLDDAVTRAALGQATRLFGATVDYCLCTQGLDPARARSVLAWASQPVEWWPVSDRDNAPLAAFLEKAGCPPEHFGYWWKWFPERARPDAPEWILDGDMVITGRPTWFERWVSGDDPLRVSQDDRETPARMYGRYVAHVDLRLKLYSGLISLPPGRRYMSAMSRVLSRQPLVRPHDGRRDMCEQGVMAATFQELKAIPIPLYEFPFGRAFEDYIDYGHGGDQGRGWGYHFGNAFRMPNPHFDRLTEEGVVYSRSEPSLLERFQWLGGTGQWGVPGWTMPDETARLIIERAAAYAGRSVLELGTSRGRMAAMLATLGCHVTTVDHQDRGARKNLEGLSVEVVQADAVHFLSSAQEPFDLIVCDLHGNSPADWQHYAKPLMARLGSPGTMLISNAALDQIPEWFEESGVRWFISQLPVDWRVEMRLDVIPGLAVVTRP